MNKSEIPAAQKAALSLFVFPKVISKKIDLKDLAREMESMKRERAPVAAAA